MTCKDCDKRHIGCHAECEIYQAWHKERTERKAAAYMRFPARDYTADAMAKTTGKSRNR